jgi:RNA polymerase sigma-70 factor (ECF subfamily)
MERTMAQAVPGVSDEALAAAARNGDRAAYAQLVERYRDLAYACAFALLRSREDAEDAAQEAFLRAYASLPRYDPRRCWAAWMMRIVRNLCRDVHRRRQVRVAALHSLRPDEAHPGPEAAVLEGETRRLLAAAVESLPERLRAPLLMHYGSGLTYREVAAALDLPESTVVGRLAGALRRLRRDLAKERKP